MARTLLGNVKGPQGDQGEAGYTPVRGVDYWTESDIEAMEEDVIAVVGQDMSGILGLDADFENNTFTRMGEAEGKTAGAGFDVYPMYGGRRRCNVTDGGVVVAMQGESAYTETGALTAEVTVDGESYPAGTAVQVMVYQPKFYYRVQAMKREPIEGGEGYHLRRARYMVSGVARDGFRLHPAFVRNGLPRDYILLSAYEGSLWDADGGEEGTGAYILDNAQVMSTSADKLCSIAGAKPVSGSTQQLTRANARALAHNRGNGWELQTIAALSCSQLLMAIEYASFNVQDAIGRGVNGLSGAVNTRRHRIAGGRLRIGRGDGQPGLGDLPRRGKPVGEPLHLCGWSKPAGGGRGGLHAVYRRPRFRRFDQYWGVYQGWVYTCRQQQLYLGVWVQRGLRLAVYADRDAGKQFPARGG